MHGHLFPDGLSFKPACQKCTSSAMQLLCETTFKRPTVPEARAACCMILRSHMPSWAPIRTQQKFCLPDVQLIQPHRCSLPGAEYSPALTQRLRLESWTQAVVMCSEFPGIFGWIQPIKAQPLATIFKGYSSLAVLHAFFRCNLARI